MSGRLILASALLVAGAPLEEAAAVDVPDGMRWKQASVKGQAAAHKRLKRMLAAKDEARVGLLGGTAITDPARLLLGPMETLEQAARRTFDFNGVMWATLKIPLTEDFPLEARMLGARDENELRRLREIVRSALPEGPPHTIRPPNFNELAQLWYMIGWDLDGPLLVADWERDSYLFDFDAAGERIQYVDRTTRPCFTLGQGETRLMSCMCMMVDRRGQQWQMGFLPQGDEQECEK